MKPFLLCFLCVVNALIAQDSLTIHDIESAEKIFGLRFTNAERESLLSDVHAQRKNFLQLRTIPLPNHILPSLVFNPIPPGMTFEKKPSIFAPAGISQIRAPKNIEDLAFASIGELSALMKERKITSEQLTRMYLHRIRTYQPMLLCVITVTESLAIAQAKKADDEIAAGKYRGPLHGIPYGAKDLLAAKTYPTTWGSVPYQNQIIRNDAVVIQKLEEAGSVLIAKTTMGELAWGDVWFGGKTRNPWDTTQGSSGSSAGSASGTAAGLFAFAIGSETYGSIVSPSTRCGTTGLRPTFGRVSRTGAMALSWSMDKLGPICRTVEDCAIVFHAIYGHDPADPSTVDLPFHYAPKTIALKTLRIGYVKNDFDSARIGKAFNDSVLAVLQNLGATLIPLSLPQLPVNDISIMLSAESAAAFDELTRTGKDDLLVRQIKNAWPNSFRSSRFIPAVEYLQASRVRQLLIQEMKNIMDQVDVYLAPSLEGDNLLLTNLTGHPSVVVPIGFDESGHPVSITFTGRLYDEGTLLSVAKQYQDATSYHLRHPQLTP